MKKLRLISGVLVLPFLLAIAALILWADPPDPDRMEHIAKRGRLIVGVKADYKPWGYYKYNQRSKQIDIIGMEPDLARDIAYRLSRKLGRTITLDLVPVTTSNRLQKLEHGAVDLVIATMADTEERQKLSGLLEPHYYASGVNILLPKDSQIKQWEDLKEEPVCLTKGAYYNQDIIQKYAIKAQIFEGTDKPQQAVNAGQCLGWAYDDTVLKRLFIREKHIMPLPSILIEPWSVAVSQKDREAAWGRFVSNIVVDWHQSGFLLALERKWGLTTSSYLKEQQSIWKKLVLDREFFCAQNPDNRLSAFCSEQGVELPNGGPQEKQEGFFDFLLSGDMFGLKTLLKGMGLTILLSIIAIFGSLVFGLGLGILQTYCSRPIRKSIEAVNSIFYLTPPLLNLYTVFFGLGGWASIHYGLVFDAFVVASVIFTLYAGSSNAVIVSSAFRTLRSRRPDARVWQIFPAVVEHSFGGLAANSVNTVKAISIASSIAVPELLFSASSLIARHGHVFEIMNFLMLFYLLLVSLFLYGLTKLGKWVSP